MITFLPFSLLEKREVATLWFWQMIKHLVWIAWPSTHPYTQTSSLI